MKSIKPGRGPSMMSGIMSVALAIFGVFWTLFAVSMGAPIMFALFGLFFVGIALYQGAYNFKNATSKNRYSSFDIVDSQDEPDPLSERFGTPSSAFQTDDVTDASFCPYCGAQVKDDFSYCAQCGKKLPS